MFYYMFHMDTARPEVCACRLAEKGFRAVVGISDRRCIDAVRESGMEAYACVGAFSLGENDRRCIDIDGVERIWFGSGCPNDESAFARREEEWFNLAQTEGLSGVFIDGARFASPASAEGAEGLFTCFCPQCVQRMEQMGLDVEKVRAGVRKWRDGECVLPPKAWLTFRQRTVDSAMERFVRAIKSAGATLKTGAFVFPASLGALVGQTNSACGGMDVTAPMLYRRYDEPDGPATLNHEYGALVRMLGRERTRELTGIDVPEDVRENGFLPEALTNEVRRVQTSGMLAPILQLKDERIADSIRAVRDCGAQGVGFFMYDPEWMEKLPPLDAF